MSNIGKIQTINPTTGKIISSYDIMSIDRIEGVKTLEQD
jgi:hypothetical protein